MDVQGDFLRRPYSTTIRILIIKVTRTQSCCHLLNFKVVHLFQNGRLPRTLYWQADNCWRENKNKYTLGFCELLVREHIFDEVSFLVLVSASCMETSLCCPHLSHVMRKPVSFICENDGADQLCSNCAAH